MREIDLLTTRDYHVPSLSLMQAAAEACFQAIASHFASMGLKRRKAQVLCGPGNNGGDGAGLAVMLAHAGVEVDVVLFGRVEDTSGDAQTNFEIVRLAAADYRARETQFSEVPDPPFLTLVECNSLAEWKNLTET